MSSTTRITDRGDMTEVELEIPDFLSLYTEGNGYVYSDDVDVMGISFFFEISTGTGEMDETFIISIMRNEWDTKCGVVLGFSFKREGRQVESISHIQYLTFLSHEIYRAFQFPSFSRDVLQCRRSELLPFGVLTLVFTLWMGEQVTSATATVPTRIHPGLLPSVEFPQECAATSPTTRILTDRVVNVNVEFKIPDFLSLYREGERDLRSDDCLIADHRFRFEIGSGAGEMNEAFPVFFYRYRPESVCCAVLAFGIKKEDGQVENVAWIPNVTFLSREIVLGFHFPSFSRDVLQERRSELLPSGVLTLVFMLYMRDMATASTCCEPSSSESLHNMEAIAPTESEKYFEKLSDDLNDLMLSGEESDFTVKVQEEEFHLHRNILGARTPVFRSMLRSEMKEKRTGCVYIDDCEPGTFREFVRYVYTGRADELSTDTVFALYALADKYQVDELKSACLGFIHKTLSIDTFCDVVTLALTYDIKDLLEHATRYFIQNTTAIIQTVKWMNFMIKNPIQANELNLKAFRKITQNKFK